MTRRSLLRPDSCTRNLRWQTNRLLLMAIQLDDPELSDLGVWARLYRLRTAASFGEIVTNDGVLLLPVNDAIPAAKSGSRWRAHCVARRLCTTASSIRLSVGGGKFPVHDLPGQRCHTRAYFCNMTWIPEGDFAAVYHELALEFVAELMQVTYGADTAAAFQHALQIYVDELRPWLRERDVPETVRSTFSMRAVARINAGRPQKYQAHYAAAPRLVHDAGLDGKVLLNEICRVTGVGENAPDLGRGQKKRGRSRAKKSRTANFGESSSAWVRLTTLR